MEASPSPQVIVMRGAPTDNNATLFAKGYDAVLTPLFKSGQVDRRRQPGRDLDSADRGDRVPAGLHRAPERQRRAHPERRERRADHPRTCRRKGVKPKTFPITGQDATLVGLQNIISGYQCGTVYKPIYLEAQAAAALAMYLRAGKTPPAAWSTATTEDTVQQRRGAVGAR